jgi:hypothetical protein
MKTILSLIMVWSLGMGSISAFAQDVEESAPGATADAPAEAKPTPGKKVIYKDTSIDFEGLSLDGELKAPGEFYFQNRNQERFDSLSKRRLNFRREMLRDAVQSN